MLCTFCSIARLDNEAPCPHCGAPSPLIAATNGGYRASLLPVPYHQPQQQQPFSTMGMMYGQNDVMIPLPEQERGLSIHSFPGEDISTPIYVAPMYTKPRAIIPRYRAISGLLSVLIVTAFLCVGAGYYLKVSGKLAAISQLAGFVPPANIQPAATAPLPNPTATIITGPAYSIINSATTTAKIDPKTYLAIEPDTIFKTNTPIYVTYSVQNPKGLGQMTVEWYTNGAFYQASPPLNISKAISGYDQQEYSQPAEGKVELYWNGQLAITLFFVVR